MVTRLGVAVEVPANASRYFDDPDRARSQQTGRVLLAWDELDPFLFNEEFDSSLIAHDDNYCTSVVDLDRVVQVPTMLHLPHVLRHLPPRPIVVDIGCGQGEFVSQARSRHDIAAYGFDPVVRAPDEHLFARYWDGSIEDVDLFVMRCVLPHIPDPFSFVRGLASQSQRRLVLIEYQRWEWILANSLWYQISHDHVNLFRLEDFEARFDVVDHGTFAEGEWAWVLLDPASYQPSPARSCEAGQKVSDLWDARRGFLDRVGCLGRPLAIWGAAGKGIVLAHALTTIGRSEVVAVDADPLRVGKHMEVSGTPIIGVRQLDQLQPHTLILVSNPNHLQAVRAEVGARWDVALPQSLLETSTSSSRRQPE